MKVIFRGLVSLLLLVVCGAADAYELATHGRLTYESYERSVLFDPKFIADLGIQNGKNPFGEIYYDTSGSSALERLQQPFEQEADRMPAGTEPLSLEGWLMRGAIREDDVMIGFADGQPQDDPYHPYVGFFRVFNHFYDPVHKAPLNIGGVPVGTITCGASLFIGQSLIGCQPTQIAPQWASGSSDVVSSPNSPDTSRVNHFTIFDARESMYRALTGRSADGKPLSVATNGTLTKPADIRNAYWATTFRALGDVVHLVQDMAQSQHTRNDPHSGNQYDANGPLGLGSVLGHKM